MNHLIKVDFQDMSGENLEYILNEEPLEIPQRRFQVISEKEALELYFPTEEDKVNVYVVVGGQKGDEAKAKTVALLRRIDSNVKWVLAPNSTHNAGKGVHTKDINGNYVQLSLHLCPETIVDPTIKNYIGRETQANLISLKEEIEQFREATGKEELGEDYHLMLDLHANLVVPTNRADDVVNKPDAMGSTIAGATSSFMYAAGKKAPFVEHVLYDHDQFRKHVNFQITEFKDKIKHDQEFVELGITDMHSLGLALKNNETVMKNGRLTALQGKLSDAEIDFLIHENPAQYLLEQYQKILESNLFKVGNCTKEIDGHIDKGNSGIIEGVQSCLLSGGVAYSKNRTSAHTHGMGIIGNAGLTHPAINYEKILVFKYANTSVGGNGPTMSGFIRQDQLSKLTATSPKTNETISFEKTAALEDFLSEEEIKEAFTEVDQKFYEAIENGYSLKNSKVSIEGIGCEFTLAEARALLIAYVIGETGETSKRSRICRLDDKNETGVVRGIEGKCLEVRNAVDRVVLLDQKQVGIIIGYQVKEEYRNYKPGDIISPGDPLLQEHLTVDACIPIICLTKGWDSLYNDGTSNSAPGKMLHPDLGAYLSIISDGNNVLAIGRGKMPTNIDCIEEVSVN